MGERSLSAHYGLACFLQNASGHSFTLAEDQRCTQTHTHEKRSHTALARGSDQGRLLNTLFAYRVHNK